MEKVKEGPYPTRYVQRWKAREGTPVTFRPIRPEDEPLMAKFHESLSEQGVYNRYLHAIKLSRRVAHTQLARVCSIDYDHEMTLVADYENLATGAHEILGVGLLSKLRTMNEAEIAVQVSDYFQGRGLGTELLRRLISVGRDEQLSRIVAHIIASNHDILPIIKRLGFRLHRRVDAAGIIKATLDITASDVMRAQVELVGAHKPGSSPVEIEMSNRPESLAEVVGIIRDSNVNVVSILTASVDDQTSTIFRLSTIDPRRVVTTLKAAGYKVLWPPERVAN